jgi:hypothetical protein
MTKKIKRYKVGIDSETYAISLVESPAIEVDYVALSKQEEVGVRLSSDERHICYGPALIPNKDIYRNNGEQEFYINFTEESIIKMSQEYLKEYRQHETTLDHETNADEVYLVESWLVEDPYKDKANALGFNVPKNTWMIGMKVNNIEVWERIKAGELNGFSVESMISLEEFSKQNENNMNIETNDMFWDKLKNILKDTFSKKDEDIVKTMNENTNTIEELAAMSGFTSVEEYQKELEAVKEELEEQNAPTEPQAQEPTVEAPKVEEPVVEEPKPTEEAPKAEEKPQENNKHLEELINSLKEEINALKEMNSGLNDKVKELSKEPSAKPVNTNAKPSAKDTYSAWREQMRNMIG